MKNLIFIVAILSSILGKSQNLLGLSRTEVEFIAESEKWKVTRATTKTGMPFIEVDDDDSFKFYYFKDDICAMYLVFYNKICGDEIIKSLDAIYPKQNSEWYSDNAVIDLAYDEILKGYFVKYKLIKN